MSEDANTGTGLHGAHAAFDGALAIGRPAVPADARSRPQGRTRIVVVGEFNSGKTTLVNALLGAPVLTPSVIAPTMHPTVVAFAGKPSLSAETADRRRTPVAWGRLDDEATAPSIRRLHVGMPLACLKRFSCRRYAGSGLGGRRERPAQSSGLPVCRHRNLVHAGDAGMEGQ